MKKIIRMSVSLLLLASVLCGTLAMWSCKNDNTTTSEEKTDTSATTAAEPEKVKLVADSLSEYVLIYPDGASSTVMNALILIQNKIKDLTGVELKRKSDYLKKGTEHDPDTKEILIGKTNYTETQVVFETLHSEEFAIVKQGNKIIFTGANESYVYAAAKYFVNNLAETNLETNEITGKKTLYFEEYVLKNTNLDNEWFLNGKQISQYKIIYETKRAGYDVAAKTLMKTISDITGYIIGVYPDNTTAESEYEILIGKTNRAFSQTYYSQNPFELLTYKLVMDGKKMQIAAGGPFSAYECVLNTRFDIFAQESKHITPGTLMEKVLASVTDPMALTAGADFRIMTSNVLTYVWGEKIDATCPPVALRAEIYAYLLAIYRPDIIGVQETDQPWMDTLPYYFDYLKTNFNLDYKMIHASVGGKINYSPIIYRQDKYDVEESGATPFSYYNSTYHMRILAWAVFKDKTNPAKKFALVNTHWAWETGTHNGKTWKDICSDENSAMVNKLYEDYNCPVFSTGDFNAKPTDAHYLDFLSASGSQNTRDMAKAAGVLLNEIGGCGSVGAGRSGGNFIDHIMGKGNFSVLCQMTLVLNRTAYMSDHSAHIADIKLS